MRFERAIVVAFYLLVSSLLVSGRAAAQNSTCTEDGGTAKCVGAEVTEWRYSVGNTNAPISAYGVSSEMEGINIVRNGWMAAQHACSGNFTYLPWTPLPASLPAGSGGRTIGAGDAYFYQEWQVGTESYQLKNNYVLQMQTRTDDPTPCQNSYTAKWGATKGRTITCPIGYGPNYPAATACYIPGNTVDPPKNLGPCKDCDVTQGNPVNAATGNKFQVERDYRGSGAFPLEFTRTYNSQARTSGNTPGGGPAMYRLSPNWQGTYDRLIVLSEHYRFPTAWAYRQDGKMLSFKWNGSAYVPDPDVVSRLTRQVDVNGETTGWTLVNENDETETYDSLGRLASLQNRAGITHTLAYNSSGLLATVTHTFGQQLVFTYNATNRLSTMTVPGGLVYTYNYGTFDNLTSVAMPGSVSRTYHYENASFPRALTGITDESSTRYATFGYDTYGYANLSEHAGSVDRWQFSYTSTTNTTITDPLGVARNFTIAVKQGMGNIGAVSQLCPTCGSASKSKGFDANGNITSRTDFNNIQTTYGYDLARNLQTSRTDAYLTPNARITTTVWHPTFRIPASITEPNRTTTFTHDANGNVLTRTVTDTSVMPNVSRTWTYTYNSIGQILTADGPRTDVTDVTTYTYYTCTTGFQCGQLNTITNAAGHVMTYNSYNDHGQPIQITDPNGLVTTLAYDMRQRLTDRCSGGALPACIGGELTHLDYWPTGLLKRVTNPDASYIEYTYDAAHRLTQVQDGAFNRIVYTLDAMGKRTAENSYDPSNALKRTHSRIFNTLSQLWKDVNAAGTANVTTVFGYDNNGNQTTTNAPLSRNSTNVYDELNRLKQITDPNSGITLFGYDANDNLTSVTDPRTLVTSYTYTGFGDLKTQTSPDTGLTSNTYDSGGNLETSTDARSAVATYTYDNLNRVLTSSYKIGSTTDQTFSYTYDGGTNQKGRLTGVTDGTNALGWTYDTKGRVTGKAQSFAGVTPQLAIGYGYNAQGQLFHLVLPSGKAITFAYNSNGQVSSVTLDGSPSTTILNNITYDPFGPITGWTWGNGTDTTTRTFDTDGKLTQITSSGQRTFGYDDAFRITAANDISTPANSWTLGYDILDRLNSATKTGTTIGYTYDANGNRLTQTGTSASTYSVSSTSNRLNSVSGALVRTYGYDNSGSVTSSSATTHAYYNNGRMRTARLGAASDTTYIYNALGQRVKKSDGAITDPVYFAYDEAGHLVGEYSISGSTITTVQETVWLGDTPVATLRTGSGPSSVFYVHTDQLNTPRKVTSTSNQLRWTWDPNPFGDGPGSVLNENPNSFGTFNYNLRFAGQYFDLESNLSYNYFRDYDPATGRYDESDPIGLRGGASTYAYVKSRPLSSVDRRGLLSLDYQQLPDVRDPYLGAGEFGFTEGRLRNVKCECRQCGENWLLQGCSASLQIQVTLRTRYPRAEQDQWAQRAELDHVYDIGEAYGAIVQAGQRAEDSVKRETFSTEASCRASAEVRVGFAMQGVLNDAINKSYQDWDASGRHSYTSPNRRL